MSVETIIERIKARVGAVDPNGPRKVLGVFQLNIKTASGVEQWIVDLKQLKVDQGVFASPDVTVTVGLEDMLAISGKTLTVGDALKQGKIELSGDADLAAKLAEVIHHHHHH
uniref:Sterol carrier protein 2-like 2 n=1 Tax=Aedes aegypti TaxID=7159 RepID=UPI0009948DC0|nr:Chain A, Sterol carrier protein 2-like 2 [Aedes aegypti]2NBN_A Chain A, Sterol carrier protein 2-like 2 [Aedes aegypti]